jgi:hypothetical protein
MVDMRTMATTIIRRHYVHFYANAALDCPN